MNEKNVSKFKEFPMDIQMSDMKPTGGSEDYDVDHPKDDPPSIGSCCSDAAQVAAAGVLCTGLEGHGCGDQVPCWWCQRMTAMMFDAAGA